MRDEPKGVMVANEVLDALYERISTLEAALREIAEHPHKQASRANECGKGYSHPQLQSYYEEGVTEGHRCAAEIARKALESK